jgi:NAD(P)H-dependent FMN reductase
MYYAPVLLGSVRDGRMSSRVAKFIEGSLRATSAFEPEILDLRELDLPIMEERLRMQKTPSSVLVEFGQKIGRADALVIVTPEYNASYPGVLKNAIDYLLPEYKRKPVGIVTVSGGQFGGMQALAQLRLVMVAVGAYVLPVSFPVTKVQESFAADGAPLDPVYEKRAANFVSELLWLTEAVDARRTRDAAAG